MLSPLLYSLLTHDCVTMNASNSIIKFADDTVVGLITNNDDTAYREEVRALGSMVSGKEPLTQHKNKKKGVDRGLQETAESNPLSTSKGHQWRRRKVKFLGVHITDKLKWSTHTDSLVSSTSGG